MNELTDLGWSSERQGQLEEMPNGGLHPARVSAEHRDLFHVITERGEWSARVSGRFRHLAQSRADLPVVGDWVLVEERLGEGAATIHHVLPRRSVITRAAAGPLTEAQPLAANLDHVLVVTSCNQDFNPRRLERILTLVWESGAQPAVVLNKRDLCPDPDEYIREATAAAVGVSVHAVSAHTGEGVSDLEGYTGPGRTIAMIGSSGVGKSSLVNRLAGRDALEVQDIREHDGRGRHTTSHRELVRLPGGGQIIDTPGLREVGLWDAPEGIQETFADIEALAEACHFRDCKHQSEPRCAVQAALHSGELDAGRLRSYRKLQRELAHLARRQDQRARTEEERKWKMITRSMRNHPSKQGGR